MRALATDNHCIPSGQSSSRSSSLVSSATSAPSPHLAIRVVAGSPDVLGIRPNSSGVFARGEPDRVRDPPLHQLLERLRPAGPIDPDQHLPPRPGSHPTCVSASAITLLWSAAVFEPAFPGRRRQVSPRTRRCRGRRTRATDGIRSPLNVGRVNSFAVRRHQRCVQVYD